MSTWSRAWAGLVAALLVWLPALPASAQQPPPPGLGIRLLEAPTARADDPRARAYVVDRVQPGQRFSRRFEVSNGDATPMQVRLYAATAEISGGGFSIAAEGDEGEVPAWVRITPASAVLQPGERPEVTADFAVPEDVPEGEYYGALVAERLRPRTRTA